jgi:hypothetical protein
MRDGRDYVIAALAAALLFCVGILVGRSVSVLAPAHAQEQGGFQPEQPLDAAGPGVPPVPSVDPIDRYGTGSRGGSETASDSDSNNRFVAVTCPIGSGESVLYVLDAKSEQVVVYRYVRRKGLEFLAARKIDYDLRVKGYKDVSEFARDDLRTEYHKQIARDAATAVKESGGSTQEKGR